MQFYAGTSGYSYAPWKGSFYPQKLPAKDMLRYYAEHFPAVEINGSFRKLPMDEVVKSWGTQTPADFQFVLKAPRRITHIRRLANVDAEVKDLLRVAALLKRRRGPLFFQLPPNFKKDVPRLEAFLKLIPKSKPAAFEFRHASWFDEDVYAALRARGCALCLADTDELPVKQLVSTASWGYLRMRRERYTAAALRAWVKKIRAHDWERVHVFFKHEGTGTGPRFAKALIELAADPLKNVCPPR